jgi:cathepsin L
MFALFALAFSAPYLSLHDEKSFVSWMRDTNQLFVGDEYQTRFGIWLTNKRFVQEHNAGSSTFKVGLNHLAALTPAEYRSLLGFKPDLSEKKRTTITSLKLPDTVDWRDEGVINPIQDQGQCGSCWAFSAIQSIESLYAIKNTKLYKLSEQELVDCVTADYGCDGGLMTDAFDYVLKSQAGSVNLLSDYPYTAKDGRCKYNASIAVKVLSSYDNVKKGSESDLQDKVAKNGPVAIAIDASQNSFQLYTSGIYDEKKCSSTSLDHGVGAVGYGTDNGVDYWLDRNNWELAGEKKDTSEWFEIRTINVVKQRWHQLLFQFKQFSLPFFPLEMFSV